MFLLGLNIVNRNDKNYITFRLCKDEKFTCKASVKQGGSHKLLRGTFRALDEQNKGLMNVPRNKINNANKIHDSVGKALRTADEGHVTANSHPRFIRA